MFLLVQFVDNRKFFSDITGMAPRIYRTAMKKKDKVVVFNNDGTVTVDASLLGIEKYPKAKITTSNTLLKIAITEPSNTPVSLSFSPSKISGQTDIGISYYGVDYSYRAHNSTYLTPGGGIHLIRHAILKTGSFATVFGSKGNDLTDELRAEFSKTIRITEELLEKFSSAK